MSPLQRLFDRAGNWAASVDWTAVRRALTTFAKRCLVILAVVAVLVVILYGARWSCELNPHCPWSNFWSKR
jgi:hypothetical protein